ncbi:hypothetical protein S7711_00889 [Stachybotrys chartarum IBT 7711]|uniref:PWI domain-containing protein n=1 Tax=Stachybotrys chartarum (strain CBS 109288 / IBT 7711) TaxID=1280523 RepID=A0A084B0I6_STACB|nr:hypothetical protein S7711_00889 [Stachybotrys chartarum IBT 7711]
MASSVDARLLKSTRFPPEFNQKVDMQKVNLQVMKKWIASRISEILQNEDDVVIELCFNLIEGSRFPDIKSLQIQLTGFLDKETAPFCKELWKLLLSAQTSPQGVPKELLEAKKLELMQEKIEADRAAVDARRGAEAIHGKAGEETVVLEIGLGAAIAEKEQDQDRQSLATETDVIAMAAIAMSHEVDQVEVGTGTEVGSVLGAVHCLNPRLHALGREVAACHGIARSQRARLLENHQRVGGETLGRGRDPGRGRDLPVETPTDRHDIPGIGETTVATRPVDPFQNPQTDARLSPNDEDIRLPEVDP